MGSAGTVVVLAAGMGKRMRSELPKVLHPLCGRPILGYVLDQARSLDPERILVVTGHGGELVKAWVEGEEPDERVRFVNQAEQLGTGHAVQVCLEELESCTGPVVILYGDMPLLRPESLVELIGGLDNARAAATTAFPDKPRGFGRIVREEGAFCGIVEEKDATPEQLEISEVNVGVYAFAIEDLRRFLPQLSNDNAQREFYLTDLLGLVRADGGEVATTILEDEGDAIGINTLSHLAEARAEIQIRILEEHLANGVQIEDPATTYVDHGVSIGAGTTLLPCVVIKKGVEIGERCSVGPFTHLRVGSVLEDRAEIGNFTEAKNSRLGSGTKAKHLSYLGDVTIGAKVNIGAGTIVANYDGKKKHPTRIEDGAFIGSGSILIAPCTIGEGALTGAGAVVKKNSKVPANDAWVGVPARSIVRRDQK